MALDQPPLSYEPTLPRKICLTSIAWVLGHEWEHANLGHFSLLQLSSQLNVVSRKKLSRTAPLQNIQKYGSVELSKCLELQADHEASDSLLGSYSAREWHELRQKVFAISTVMIFIELEDTKNGFKGRTHPNAATRIFQLLGHLAEMPLLRAQVHRHTSLIPAKKELQAYSRDVTIPCFFDAIQLAQTAGAASIANDLGSPEDFFKDLEIVKLGDPSRYDELKTQGAQEWAKLWPCNEALKPILGGHFNT